MRVEVAANVGSAADASAAAEAGADGIGLLRSEFLFTQRSTLPDEREQEAVYRGIAERLDGRPVILRTLDVGADKPLAALPQPPELNPSSAPAASACPWSGPTPCAPSFAPPCAWPRTTP